MLDLEGTWKAIEVACGRRPIEARALDKGDILAAVDGRLGKKFVSYGRAIPPTTELRPVFFCFLVDITFSFYKGSAACGSIIFNSDDGYVQRLEKIEWYGTAPILFLPNLLLYIILTPQFFTLREEDLFESWKDISSSSHS
ncbi:hypothetical protein GOBAR_DD13276 [Gossypium barbadense]|nr:hypothetical protein GOBAR_DD13276 [Gossypium barbadense]